MTSSERDTLISRVVDGVAGEADWKALDTLAASEPAIWRELAQSQRQQATLLAAVDEALSRVEEVSLPNPAAHQFSARVSSVARWGGWAAAAAVAIAWMGGVRPPANRDSASAVNQAGLLPVSAADTLSTYLKQGQESGDVLGEVPNKLMLEAVPVGDGSFDVYFVRQIVEKVRVNDLYRQSTDESGRIAPGSFKVRMTPRTGSY